MSASAARIAFKYAVPRKLTPPFSFTRGFKTFSKSVIHSGKILSALDAADKANKKSGGGKEKKVKEETGLGFSHQKDENLGELWSEIGVKKTRGDGKGLVLPPKLAATQVIVIPVPLKDTDTKAVFDACLSTVKILSEAGLRAKADLRDNYSPGWKYSHWEKQGVPLRIEIGPKDMANNQVYAVRRDSSAKKDIPMNNLVDQVKELLDTIQKNPFDLTKEKKDAKLGSSCVSDSGHRSMLETATAQKSAEWNASLSRAERKDRRLQKGLAAFKAQYSTKILYERYFDEILLGIEGPIEVALEIKERITNFLQSTLNIQVRSAKVTRGPVEFRGMVIRHVPPKKTPAACLKELEKRIRVKKRIHNTASQLRTTINSKFRNLAQNVPLKQLTKGASKTRSLLDAVQLAEALGTPSVTSPRVSRSPQVNRSSQVSVFWETVKLIRHSSGLSKEVKKDVKARTKDDMGEAKTFCMPLDQPVMVEGTVSFATGKASKKWMYLGRS